MLQRCLTHRGLLGGGREEELIETFPLLISEIVEPGEGLGIPSWRPELKPLWGAHPGPDLWEVFKQVL